MSPHRKKGGIQTVLITGGTGFIGSHLAISLITSGYNVIILDNLSHSSRSTLDTIVTLCNKFPVFYDGDIRDKSILDIVFSNNSIDLVIHLAGLKSISESCQNVSLYHDNNIVGSIRLFEAMEKYDCRAIVFSSTGTVYSEDNIYPLKEEYLVKPVNPYSSSKLIIEYLLQDFVKHAGWRAISLRYFNPIGAHSSGLIGEDFHGSPSNILPIIMKKIIEGNGATTVIPVFGNDYDTLDGTCIRDYIHIRDLATAHIDVLNYMENKVGGIFDVFNIGTGTGISVIDMICTIGRITGIDLKYKIVGRRNGDISKVFCDAKKAMDILGWKPKYNYEDAIRDYWHFVKMKMGK